MRLPRLKTFSFVAVVLGAFVYGVVVGQYRVFPYDQMKSLQDLAQGEEAVEVPDRKTWDEYFQEYKIDLGEYGGPESVAGLPGELLWRANKGRRVVDERGQLIFPANVKRVWLDVGAFMLHATVQDFFGRSDLALVGVEPMERAWKKWPNFERLITLPFALNDTEGIQTFHIMNATGASSLFKARENAPNEEFIKVVEEVPVHVFRLDRILDMIPEDVPIEYLKLDAQGADLAIIKSAGESLRRIKKVRVEVILIPIYEPDRPGLENEFIQHMSKHGFRFQQRTNVAPDGSWEDVDFINENWPPQA